MIKFTRVSLDKVNTKTIINLFQQHGENVTLKYYYENKIKRKNIFVIVNINLIKSHFFFICFMYIFLNVLLFSRGGLFLK